MSSTLEELPTVTKGGFECRLCNKLSKSWDAYDTHRCPVISKMVKQRLDEIVEETRVPPLLVKTNARNWVMPEDCPLLVPSWKE